MDDIFDFRDFVFTILRRWRLVGVMGITFALLLGVYKIAPGISQLPDQEAIETESRLYAERAAYYESQKARIEQEFQKLNTDINSSLEYSQKSILMKINPYEKYEAAYSFSVDTGYEISPELSFQPPDKAGLIIDWYMIMVQDEALYNRMRDELFPDTEPYYLSETVTAVRNQNNSVTIYVAGADEVFAEQAADFIMKYLEEQQPLIAEQIGSYTVQQISKSVLRKADTAILEKQMAQVQNLDVLYQMASRKSSELSKLVIPVTELPTLGSVLMSGIKYLIVGCAGGIGLSLLIIFFQDAMSTRLQDAGELKKKFGLRYLGRIPAAQGKNTHRFEAVDRWICRLEGKDYEHINETEAIKNICIHTKYALMQQGGELSVLLKGILEPSLLEVLQRELSSLGISAFYDSVISNNIQNQDMFSHCGNVILVKNRNCSVLETEHEIALIREYAGVILGYIMV